MIASRHTQLPLVALVAAALFLSALPALAQVPAVSLPPAGDNQKTVVTQYMGKVALTITYNSPDVTSPAGQDRTGQIWGTLVPYGMNNLGFGTAEESPWRVGANENTTIEFSHDVLVEGEPLAAGVYGLHMIPDEEEWTIIFSHNSTSWGSFFYDPSEDALRVTVTPEKDVEFREWLTFEFLDRQWDTTLVALHWENLRVPFRVTVPDPVDLYVEDLKDELRGQAGFGWQNWNAAAGFVVARDEAGEHLEQALEWVDYSINAPFFGQANFQNLSTKAQILGKMGQDDEAWEITQQAVMSPNANPGQIHQLGRTLIGQDEDQKALELFQMSHERFDGAWPTEVGLMRGYSAVGEYEKALEHARIAHEQAPNQLNKDNLENAIQALEQGQDVN